MKRDLLAEAAAARRRAGVPSTTPNIVEDREEVGSVSRSPAPVFGPGLPVRQGMLSLPPLRIQITNKTPDPRVSTATHGVTRMVLTSEGFQALIEEHGSKKRSHAKMADEDEEEDDVVFMKAKAAKKQ